MAEKESSASELLEELRGALAETFVFYVKAHSFHWNVRGPLFNQWHDFFGALYQDAHGAVDDIAEHIRALNELAPASLDEIVAPSKIKFTSAPDAAGMVKQLRADNKVVIAALEAAQDCAEDADDEGLSNFLQDRLDKHAKWGWKLTASEGTQARQSASGRPKFDKVAKDYVS